MGENARAEAAVTRLGLVSKRAAWRLVWTLVLLLGCGATEEEEREREAIAHAQRCEALPAGSCIQEPRCGEYRLTFVPYEKVCRLSCTYELGPYDFSVYEFEPCPPGYRCDGLRPAGETLDIPPACVKQEPQ